MSGNRTLHREQVGLVTPPAQVHSEPSDDLGDVDVQATEGSSLALWSVACTSSIDSSIAARSNTTTGCAPWMIWTTGSNQDGQILRGYSVEETSLQEKQDKLEASALRMHWTHSCVDPNPDAASLGVSAIATVRNYTGEDRQAGDWILLCMDLSNVVRIWNVSAATSEKSSSSTPQEIPLVQSFSVDNATGTTAALLPPRVALNGNPQSDLEKVVSVAVSLLDGTVAIVSTGIPIFNPHQKNNNISISPQAVPHAGTILEIWGSPTSNGKGIPLTLEWNPSKVLTLAVGTGNGVVHLYSKIVTGETTTSVKHHRLSQLGSSPVRAVTFTTDGHLLIAGNDQGRLCLWDCSSSNNASHPALVNHVSQAHASNCCWILQTIPIDTRRFCTLASNRTISLWNVGQMHQAVHIFQSNQALFCLSNLADDSQSVKEISTTNITKAPRVVAGSQNGWIEIFSLEAN